MKPNLSSSFSGSSGGSSSAVPSVDAVSVDEGSGSVVSDTGSAAGVSSESEDATGPGEGVSDSEQPTATRVVRQVKTKQRNDIFNIELSELSVTTLIGLARLRDHIRKRCAIRFAGLRDVDDLRLRWSRTHYFAGNHGAMLIERTYPPRLIAQSRRKSARELRSEAFTSIEI